MLVKLKDKEVTPLFVSRIVSDMSVWYSNSYNASDVSTSSVVFENDGSVVEFRSSIYDANSRAECCGSDSCYDERDNTTFYRYREHEFNNRDYGSEFRIKFGWKNSIAENAISNISRIASESSLLIRKGNKGYTISNGDTVRPIKISSNVDSNSVIIGWTAPQIVSLESDKGYMSFMLTTCTKRGFTSVNTFSIKTDKPHYVFEYTING